MNKVILMLYHNDNKCSFTKNVSNTRPTFNERRVGAYSKGALIQRGRLFEGALIRYFPVTEIYIQTSYSSSCRCCSSSPKN